MKSTGRNIQRYLLLDGFPWAITGIVLLVVFLIEIIHPTWISSLTQQSRIIIWGGLLLCVLVVSLIIKRYSNLIRDTERLESRFIKAENSVSEAYQRLEAIFQVNQKFVDAGDENEVVEPVLQIFVELIGADGAAFVPLDEHGQPQAALSHGELPPMEMGSWVEYLASTGVRNRCKQCENYNLLSQPRDCPLLTGPFAGAGGLFCLLVKRGEHEFGVLSIFFSDRRSLDERAQTFIRALVEEMALGLDSVRLRRNELTALRQMQRIRQKTDLKVRLSELLENVHQSLEGDISILFAPSSNQFHHGLDLSLGELETSSRSFINGILQGVMASSETILLSDISGDPTSSPGLRSLMAAPLLTSDGVVVGAILIGNLRPRAFSQRQLALLQTIAGQVALVMQNASLMAELEYNTMIQERTRLAREIHDGLAQTIGYLKLQVAQMRNNFVRGETDNLGGYFELIHRSLSEAYQDARQSIDGLRISLDGDDLAGWLYQTIQEFEDLSGLSVSTQINACEKLPPEVNAQLVRILQEALSNIRKHANAQQVWVDYHCMDGDLVLEVRDNGEGFLPEDITASSRHGLRGMRERSDLLGADFQVISQPDSGTTIRIHLPLKDVEEFIL